MRFADIRLVIGTRPEAIKLQPVARALRSQGIDPTVILTGQHLLDPDAFGLGDYKSIQLSCAGRTDPHRHAEAVARAVLQTLDDAPDLLIVQGDTSSALGGAIAGFQADVAVAHVEAGLRTYDTLPWPEEQFRTSIDAGASLLFAPTALAAANLRSEGVAGQIFVTGNTAVDATHDALRHLPSPALRDGGATKILVTCHRRESWDGGLASIATALAELASDASVEIDVVLHPNPFVSSTMRQLLGSIRQIRLLNPCGHVELLGRLRDADLVLSDSGGIQEETPTLGVPLLILREKTERPEGIEAGASRLVGTSPARIVAEARRLIDAPAERAAMSRPCAPFGDGQAAKRISAVIVKWIDKRALTRRLA